MTNFFRSLKPAFVILIIFTALLGIIYPLFVCGVGHLFFPREANGSLLYHKDGEIIGSELIAQNFTQSKYFHPRPSNAGDNGFDAANSSASNLGPTSQKLMTALKERAEAYRKENSLSSSTIIPADSVMGSGSGLDPHISVANAMIQAKRVALARNLPESEVKNLIDEYTEGPDFGIFGESRVNVLMINLALDKIKRKR